MGKPDRTRGIQSQPTLALIKRSTDYLEGSFQELMDQGGGDERWSQMADFVESRDDAVQRAIVLSLIMIRRDRSDEAVRLLERLTLMRPDDDQLLRLLSMALEKSGEGVLAKEVKFFSEALAKQREEDEQAEPGRAPGERPTDISRLDFDTIVRELEKAQPSDKRDGRGEE